MFKKRVYLVEPTKLLERVTVDNMRFLNPLGHDYAGGAYNISFTGESHGCYWAEYLGDKTTSQKTEIRNQLYKNVYGKEFYIYELCYWVFFANSNFVPDETKIKVTGPNGFSWTGKSKATTGNILKTINAESVGKYTVTYSCHQKLYEESNITYTFYILNNTVAKKPYTITDVINRILNAGVGAWNGYYKLDPALAERWSKIPAPEFEITGKTLYEALLMIGGYKNIQGIPRLGPTPGSEEDWEFNYITFNLLNEGTEWIPPSKCIDRQFVHNGESYCGGLESYVDNFVDNSTNGAVRVPYPTTVRTETSDIVIDDNYAIIKTEFPIYKVNKVTQFSVNGNNVPVGDITAYIFEKSEYDNLSKYQGDFPNAKQFALYYIQGQPNIYGLVLKPEVATALGLAGKQGQFAAVQIASKRSGQNYSTSHGISAFAYSVEYTPIQSRRVRQYRPTDKYPNGNLLYYNQSANIVDSKNYGGRMKGELARVGNAEELETYRLFKLSDMPKVGQTKDGKKITQVDWEIGTTSIKVTLHLVKNYNRLSQYVGINSMQRFYEVSEKQATNRACNFSYISKIGNAVDKANSISVLKEAGIKAFSKVFSPTSEDNGDDEISFVVATAYDIDGTQIQSPTVHAVSSNGFGNSMCFFFSFEDNYSAGGQAEQDSSARKMQRAVPYGDEYGEFYSLKMQFYKFKTERNKEKYPKGFVYSDQYNGGWCDLLPQVTADDFDGSPYLEYIATIDKNSGEKISVETQIHFQANEPDVIIGTALGDDNPLVTNIAHTHTFVCLPYQLEILQENIPVEDIETYKVATPQILSTLSYIEIGRVRNTTGHEALSWACVNENGDILLGRNRAIANGSSDNTATVINFDLTIK